MRIELTGRRPRTQQVEQVRGSLCACQLNALRQRWPA